MLLPLMMLGACAVSTNLSRDLTESEFVVPRDGARSASIEIITPGDLEVHGGECSLVQARARYDAARSHAKVDYTLDDAGFGEVRIALTNESSRRDHGHWDVCISNSVPLQLDLAQGNGDADVDLSGVQLRGLTLQAGAGDVNLDLDEAYVSDAQMLVQRGHGDFRLDASQAKIAGHSSVEIQAGGGDVDLDLPANVALRVVVERGPGDLSVHGLEQDEGAYVNAAWADANAKDRLEILLQAGPGDTQISVES